MNGPVSNVVALRPHTARRVDPGSRPPLFDWVHDEGNTVPLCLTPMEWSLLVGALQTSRYAAVVELADTVTSQIGQHISTHRHPSNRKPTQPKDTA